MGDVPLSLDRFLWRAEHLHPDQEIVAPTAQGLRRTTMGDWLDQVDRIGPLLDQLGISADGRVGTLCWTSHEHLELYIGVPVSGRVLHPINIRLSPDQLAYVVNQAKDEAVFVDRSLLGVIAPQLAGMATVRHLVVIEDGSPVEPLEVPIPVHDYAALKRSVDPRRGVIADERQAASILNTTGTTGPPKGVVSSHRSLVLHAMGLMMSGWAGIDDRDTLFTLVPLFHANSLTFPHVAIATGARLVLPGSDYSGAALAELLEAERVTATCGVPTHYTMMLPHLRGRDLSSVRIHLCGSAAVPPSLSAEYQKVTGTPLNQGWGMSEAGPISTLPPSRNANVAPEEAARLRSLAGTPLMNVEMRIVDDEGRELAWDGLTGGELEVRGYAVVRSYLDGAGADAFTHDGWLKTGDIATIDDQGFLRIVDRIKDVIKSGGEWISAISLELAASEHPDIADAGAVGAHHAKWSERPVLFVQARDGYEDPLDLDGVRAFLAERLERWWLPDEIVQIDEIPRNVNSKVDKRALQVLFADLVRTGAIADPSWLGEA